MKTFAVLSALRTTTSDILNHAATLINKNTLVMDNNGFNPRNNLVT